MRIGNELFRFFGLGDFNFMRDVGRCGRGLGACGTFVAYLVRWSEERSSLGADFIKMSSVFCNIALVYGVFVYNSVLLA